MRTKYSRLLRWPMLVTTFLVGVSSCRAQALSDSLSANLTEFCEMALVSDSLTRDEMQFNTEGMTMALGGAIQSIVQRNFVRQPGVFHHHGNTLPDYAPALTPLAAAWALKAFGVDSRSTTRRMATSNGIALGLTVGLSQALRYGISEQRPDGTDSHSLPSVHSALAFMGATVLSREYGHISPWIPVGGYAVATGTQMLNLRHNANWPHDLMVGACIGTVSTNLAYYLTDLIYGTKGIRPSLVTPAEKRAQSAWNFHPSGLRFISGAESCSRGVTLEGVATNVAEGLGMEGVELNTSSGVTAGLAAEWYLSDIFYLGAEYRMTMSMAKLQGLAINAPAAYGQTFYLNHGNVTAGFTAPAVKGKRIGLRALAGVRHSRELIFRATDTDRELLTVPSELRPEAGVGIVIDMLARRNQNVGFTLDYLHTFGTEVFANRLLCLSSWKVFF